MHKQLVFWNEQYLFDILKFENKFAGSSGLLPYVVGNDDHNQLIKINSVFSNVPRFMPVDRTLSTKLAFKTFVPRPWKIPVAQRSLDDAMEARVSSLLQTNCKINLMWSGGIDSTAMVTAFLKNSPDLSQLRILYSPWSTYEHPDYFILLKKIDTLEKVDVSGIRYLNWDFDGIFVSGDGGDELMSSIDESFLEEHGWDALHQPWRDLFLKKYPYDYEFIKFSYEHFLNAGRDISTVLEARWWFYTSCKSRSILNLKYCLFFDQEKVDINSLRGFYDSDELESYIYYNINECMPTSDYASWKQPLKDYTSKFDGNVDWARTKIKTNSLQLFLYSNKKNLLKNQHWLALLSDGSRVSTPSLPLLTKLEYNKYIDLKWVFND